MSGVFAGAGWLPGMRLWLHAALIDERTGDLPHHRVIGAADQHGGAPLLCHQPDLHELLAMMGEGGSGDADPLLQASHGHTGIPGAHEGLENAKPRRVAERFKAGGDIIKVHTSMMIEIKRRSSHISIITEIRITQCDAPRHR